MMPAHTCELDIGAAACNHTRMSPTQQEIAGRLGVSRSLVSRALQGTAAAIRANPATVRRIRAEAARLGYRPSAAALALRGGPTRSLGVLVKDFGDPYFGQMLAELDRLAHSSELNLVMTGWTPGRGAVVAPAWLVKYRPDGLLLVGSDFLPAAALERAAAGLAVVRVGSGTRTTGIAQVAMDEPAGLVRLVGYLLQLGHRSVGYLAVSGARSRRREAALRKAAALCGMAEPRTAPEKLWRQGSWARRMAVGGTRAWVAFDDLAAIRALRAWSAAGLRLPDDLSLVGVDDIPAAALVTPALTTLRQPVRAMVRRAFEMVLAPGGATEVLIAPELEVRASCAAPPARGRGVRKTT